MVQGFALEGNGMLKRIRKNLFGKSTERKPLRLWPGVVIVVLQWLLWLVIPWVVPGDDAMMLGVFGGFLGGLAVFVWWGFFSRAIWFERWGAIVLMIAALFVTSLFIHESIAILGQG